MFLKADMEKESDSKTEAAAASIGCILVNYRSPREMLERCLASLFEPDRGVPLRVIMVDNNSGDGVAEQARADFPLLQLVHMSHNAGFAAAVNRGLAEVSEPFVLLLNTDAVLTPGALDEMARSLEKAGPRVAGVAPKMMSSSHEGILDAIGTVMPPTGAPFNRGIGQCDLGQYDRVEEVAGVCFGAALLRWGLFEPDEVGPLYEDYFLYFEDSDWCMRAVSQGYRFLTAPGAVVLHEHSGVTRHETLVFKYRLIELNTLKIVTRTFESPGKTARIVLARSARLLARTFIRRRFIRANLSTLVTYLSALPALLGERRHLKTRRTVSDQKIFAMAKGEGAWFDTVSYTPDRCLDSLIDTYERLLHLQKDPRYGKILAVLYRMKMDEAAERQTIPKEEIAELFAGEPMCVRELLRMAARRPEVVLSLLKPNGN